MSQVETRTAEGAQAYSLLDWANADPAGRAEQAKQQVNELARSLAGRPEAQTALAEVRDVGGILYKLADSAAAGTGSAASAHPERHAWGEGDLDFDDQ